MSLQGGGTGARSGDGNDTLESAYHYGGQLVCHYLRDAHSVLRVHALDGSYLRNIPLPGLASLAAEERVAHRWAISGRARSGLMHFKVTSFTESGAIWQHDLATGQTPQVEPSGARIRAPNWMSGEFEDGLTNTITGATESAIGISADLRSGHAQRLRLRRRPCATIGLMFECRVRSG